jgi:MYXO-CTERM domain-containing protein
MRSTWFIGVALASGVALVAALPTPGGDAHEATPPTGPALRRPAPTGHVLDEDAERRNKAARKRWFAERHRAPPGVDWKEAERANGLAQIQKRNAGLRPMALPSGATPRWQERGSDNQSGRMHATRLTSDGVMYAGSSLGGVWRADPDGVGWTPIGDNLFGGGHFLEVWTGDGGAHRVLAASAGGLVHVTADDGATWTSPLDFGLQEVRELVRQRGTESESAFLLGKRSGVWELYRTDDEAASFETLTALSGAPGDVWVPRDGGEAVYLADAGVLRYSPDRGESWEVRGTFGASDRGARLTGSEAGGPRLWVMVDDDHLLRSDDGGFSWSEVSNGHRGDFWGHLTGSVVDPDLVVWSGVELHRSTDGGVSSAVVNTWGEYYADPSRFLHADIMGLEVQPDGVGGEAWYVGTDGGLYRSTDGLRTVQNLSLAGLRVSQYYSTLTSAVDPGHVAGGAQDQGYQVTNRLDQPDDLYEFDQIISGDYAHLTSGDGSHDLVWSVYPGFILVQIGEDEPQLSYADYPGDEAGRYFAWLPPLTADPDDPEAFFFCATQLWRYERVDAWTWRPELWSNQRFDVDAYEFLSAFSFDRTDPSRAWATTSYGKVFWSEDAGKTWTQAIDDGPWSHYFYGTAVWQSRTEPDTVYIGGSGYGYPAVWRSLDGGRTWDPFSDGLPDTLVYTLNEAPDGSGVLFAGTETAAYRRDPDAAAWTDITGADAPVTIYWSSEALAHENTIRFGTYGRGIWDYQMDPEGVGCYPPVDRDGDGHACDVDCDDANDAVYPGADDPCDDVDDDCDPATSPLEDADGDGSLACDDCDDADSAVHPDATERCGNGVDDDCDGATDCPDLPEYTVMKAPQCGCSSAPAGAPWFVLAVGFLVARRRRAAAAGAVIAATAAGCSPPAAGPTPAFDPDSGVLLDAPWPSDLRRHDDGRLDLTGFPDPYGLPILADYIDAAEQLEGFGTSSPIYVRFDGPLDTSRIPEPADTTRPDSPVQLVNVDPNSPAWGARVPVTWSYVSEETTYQPADLLSITPVFGFPLAPRTTYALVVTTDLASPSPTFRERALDPSGDLAAEYADLRAAAFLLGLEPERIAIATQFTTQDTVGEMATISAFLRHNIDLPSLSQTVRYIDTGADPLIGSPRFLVFQGVYAGPVFQEGERPYREEGGGFAFGPDGLPVVTQWDSMRMAISVPLGGDPPESGYPVVLYAHGTGGDYASFCDSPDELEEAAQFAEAGFVGIGIDQPLHGTRGTPDTNVETDTFNYLNPDAARANFRQGAVDLMYLAELVAAGATTFTSDTGDVVPIDPDRVFIVGHSQGGLTGALAAPFLGDRVRGVVLSGAGGGLAITVVERKDPFDIASLLVVLLGMDPDEPLDESHPVIALLQTLVDVTDPIAYAPYWFTERGTWEGQAPVSVLLTSGLLDAQTPYRTAEALAAAGRLPQLAPAVTTPVAFDLRGIAATEGPFVDNRAGWDGGTVTAGFAQWDDPADHFVIFTDPDAAATYREFLATGAEGAPVIDRYDE